MSETKHSELPWRHEGGFQVWTEDGYIVAHCDRPKDAILIVRAANAYDNLVAALQEIGGLGPNTLYPSSTPISVARAALASLEEPRP